jgi:hypothetical protein
MQWAGGVFFKNSEIVNEKYESQREEFAKGRVHPDRIIGRHRHHCHLGGDAVAGFGEREIEGAANQMRQQSQAAHASRTDVL